MSNSKRPALGELAVGQRVMVRRSPNDRHGRSSEGHYVPAVVVKVARVWVDLERVGDGGPKSWRMRKDRQDEGSQYSGMNASFVTLEQHEWDLARDRAFEILRAHGIDLRYESPWKGRETELAALLDAVPKESNDR